MQMNLSTKLEFDRRIAKMKEDGFFLPSVREMSGDTRYLIVSFGGTGADALFGVKKSFEEQLVRNDVAQRVRFLAIDTDATTQFKTKNIINPDGSRNTIQIDALTNGAGVHN